MSKVTAREIVINRDKLARLYLHHFSELKYIGNLKLKLKKHSPEISD